MLKAIAHMRDRVLAVVFAEANLSYIVTLRLNLKKYFAVSLQRTRDADPSCRHKLFAASLLKKALVCQSFPNLVY